MKQRLGVIVGVLAAVLVGAFAISGTASASSDAGISATSPLQKKVKRANVRAKKVCKKARKLTRKVKGKKTKRAKAKAKRVAKKTKRRCRTSKRQLKKLRVRLRQYNANQRKKYEAAQYFDVCEHGCAYRTIYDATQAAGKWQFDTKRKATIRIQPGTYVEGVMIHGAQEGHNYDGITFMGVTADKQPNPNARDVVLEGKNAKTIIKDAPGWKPLDPPGCTPGTDGCTGQPEAVPANNAIEARNVQGVVFKNMYAKDYLANTFFVWASTNPSLHERCSDYTMDNLVSSDTRSYGFFARNCFGGTIENSEGWNHGDSAVYIGETPCDSEDWTNHGTNPAPCQANPDWTVIDNVKSHQNVLGYSGTNSKYIEIKNSSFYNNGAGIVPNTLDSERFEPSGWMKIHDNNVFWNNYNYFSTGSEFQTVSNGLGQLLGATVNYPMGVGVVLFGSDSIEVYDNNIFGNEKWGSMNFSAPVAEAFDVVANEGDDAKNLNNTFTNNKMGRNGTDPNGVDFLNDYTGGGNCYSGNTGSPAVTYVVGPGGLPDSSGVPQGTIYPACPVAKKLNDQTSSFDLSAGIQIRVDGNFDPILDPNTILGYVAADPPRDQECSWNIATPHPAFTDAAGYTYTEKRADPVTCPSE